MWDKDVASSSWRISFHLDGISYYHNALGVSFADDAFAGNWDNSFHLDENNVDVTHDLTVTSGNLATTAGTITSGAGITATTGNIIATVGTVLANNAVQATTGDITAVAGNVVATAGDLLATVGNVTANNNVSATTGSVSAGTTVTGGTGVIATTGNVTATAGDVLGDEFTYNSTATGRRSFAAVNATLTNASGITVARDGITFANTTGRAVIGLVLPDGVTLDTIEQTSGSLIDMELFRRTRDSVGSESSLGTGANGGDMTAIATVIDNATNVYYVEFAMDAAGAGELLHGITCVFTHADVTR